MRQLSSVADYAEKFSELVDQLTAYGHVAEPIYYTMRFVEGLKDDVRAAVSLHRPVDFDTAASLALLQEQVMDPHSYRDIKKPDTSASAKPYAKGPRPLPTPPRVPNQRATLVLPAEKQLCEGKTPEQRLVPLRAFCRAKGLCLKCAEKWSRDHIFFYHCTVASGPRAARTFQFGIC